MTTFPIPDIALRILTRRQAADQLGRDPKTLRNWQIADFGPRPFHVDGVALYDAVQVEAFKAVHEGGQ